MGRKASHSREQSVAARAVRPQSRRRSTSAWLLLTLAGASLGLFSLPARAPRLVWNFTESVPVGLYAIAATAAMKGDLVAILPTGAPRQMLEAYGALPAGRYLLKQLAAAEGDVVCRRDTAITINGVNAATARLSSRNGHVLPAWRGCHTLGRSDVLVLAPHPSSFDGRYFGPIAKEEIAGVARPMITFPSAQESL